VIARLRAWLGLLVRRDVLIDGHIYGGLAFACWGGWQISPAWTAVGVGLVLALLGVFSPVLAKLKHVP